VETVDEVPEALAAVVREGDVVITMGAGSIGGVPGRIAQQEQKA
jgi:UDP-N-acetylmuramate--alanine ligase